MTRWTATRWTAPFAAALLLLAAGACRDETELGGPLGPPQQQKPPEEPTANGPAAPVIDGVFSDWSPATLLVHDRLGDASGAFDVTELHAQSRGSQLFVHFDTTNLLNLSAGNGSDGTLILSVTLPDGRDLRIDFRARKLTVDGSYLSSYQLGYVASPTHAGRAFEIKLDLASLGVSAGDTIQLRIEGSDNVAAAPFTFDEAAAPAVHHSAAVPAASDIRFASLNTYVGGLTEPARSAAATRLLAAAKADIYVLQELGQTPANTITARFEAADPHADGASWHAAIQSAGSIVGNAIVSRSEVLGIPTPSSRFTGALVLLDDPGPVAVFSVHLKCCGYLGSEEDDDRLQDAAKLAATLDKLRAGTLNDSLKPYADVAVLVAGDFNDVGSDALHHVLERPRNSLPGLFRYQPPHLSRADVYTWFQSDTSFPPGVLDLMFHSQQLEPIGGFILDSRLMDADTLESLALQQADSAFSDHLMLVADFHVK